MIAIFLCHNHKHIYIYMYIFLIYTNTRYSLLSDILLFPNFWQDSYLESMGEKMPPLSHVSMSGVLTELLGQDTEIHLAILVPSVAPTCRITIALRKKKRILSNWWHPNSGHVGNHQSLKSRKISQYTIQLMDKILYHQGWWLSQYL